MRVWDLASGRIEHTLHGHTDGVMAVVVEAHGRRIVSGGKDGTVRVWNLADGTELAHWDAGTNVLCCAGHPIDPATLVYGGGDGRVVLLSLCEPRSASDTPAR